MWIPRQTYEQMLTRIAALEAENRAVTIATANTQAYLDALRLQLGRVEHERAQLLYNYTGVKVPVPTIEKSEPTSVAQALHAVPSFDDVGDKEAAAFGLAWNDAGELIQSRG